MGNTLDICVRMKSPREADAGPIDQVNSGPNTYNLNSLDLNQTGDSDMNLRQPIQKSNKCRFNCGLF